MPLKELIIRADQGIGSGQVWCSPDAFEHIKKLLGHDGNVKIPTKEELEKE